MFGGSVMSQFVNINSAVAVFWVALAARLKRFCVDRRRSRPGLRRSPPIPTRWCRGAWR